MDAAERLIGSTQELLWERGYVGTSPKAILARAGAGQGSMYHHFSGKADLARTAIDRTARELRAEVENVLAGPGTAVDRIAAYLRRERDVLKGCPIGGLTQDPEIIAVEELRRPVEATFEWLHSVLTEIIADGRVSGELNADLDPAELASTIMAVLQGGYVLARAANDPARFDQAVAGVIALLRVSR